MACENRQRITQWLRLSSCIHHMSQERWMNGVISPAPLLTVQLHACLLWGYWMAVPLRIVELEASSSHTLIMALGWRIPEASSLIDSSVPFLPRLRQAESCYCPTTRCTRAGKQSGSHSCTHAQYVQMDSEEHTWTFSKNNMQCTLFAHLISSCFIQTKLVFQLFPQFALHPQPPLSGKPSTSLNPNSLCVFMLACVSHCGSVCIVSALTLSLSHHCFFFFLHAPLLLQPIPSEVGKI